MLTAIALIMVTSNIAAECSQGTLRNLLVRESGRLRLLAGKMFALLLFVAISLTLTLLISAALIIAVAQSQGISTAAWTSSEGMRAFLSFFGNEVLCIVGIILLGMLIAVLTRSIGTTVGVALAYVLVPEGAIAMVWPEGSKWSPSASSTSCRARPCPRLSVPLLLRVTMRPCSWRCCGWSALSW